MVERVYKILEKAAGGDAEPKSDAKAEE